MKTWLIIDCHYLAYRALHTTGVLKHGDIQTGVMYGFMRDIITLQEEHDTDRMAFCFDHRDSFRKAAYPAYKDNRGELDPEKLKIIKGMRTQIDALREDILPNVGFENVFIQPGYEADDIIASIVTNLREGHEAIIVSADKDLYQLLSDRVMIWNPTKKKMTTQATFFKEYGVEPSSWADVKAIAGCATDNIVGIKGVGEKTAAAFLTGKLSSSSAKHEAIIRGNKIWRRNKPLVKLPYPGTKTVRLVRDHVNAQSWDYVTHFLGMKSLKGRAPGQRTQRDTGSFKRDKKKGFGV